MIVNTFHKAKGKLPWRTFASARRRRRPGGRILWEGSRVSTLAYPHSHSSCTLGSEEAFETDQMMTCSLVVVAVAASPTRSRHNEQRRRSPLFRSSSAKIESNDLVVWIFQFVLSEYWKWWRKGLGFYRPLMGWEKGGKSINWVLVGGGLVGAFIF